MGIKFDEDTLAVEQNNYLNKIVNVSIVYELYDWPKVSLKSFTLKDCLFRAINIVKNSHKDKWVFTGYGIKFDGGDLGSFSDGTARNIITFEVNNSSIVQSQK